MSQSKPFMPNNQVFTAQDIYDYVMETPGNTNPNVLRSMLANTNPDAGKGLNSFYAIIGGNQADGFHCPYSYDKILKLSNAAYNEGGKVIFYTSEYYKMATVTLHTNTISWAFTENNAQYQFIMTPNGEITLEIEEVPK